MRWLYFGLLLGQFGLWRASALEVTLRNGVPALTLVQGQVSYRVPVGVSEMRLPSESFYLLTTNGFSWGLDAATLTGTALDMQVGQSLAGLVVSKEENWAMGEVLWLGFKLGCGVMGFGFCLQLVRQLGRTSPEL